MRTLLYAWAVFVLVPLTSAHDARYDDPEPCKACAVTGNLSSTPIEFITNYKIRFTWVTVPLARGTCVIREGAGCVQPFDECLIQYHIQWRAMTGHAPIAGMKTTGAVTTPQGQVLAENIDVVVDSTILPTGSSHGLLSMECGQSASFRLEIVHDFAADPDPNDDVPPAVVTSSSLLLSGHCSFCDEVYEPEGGGE